MKKQVELCAQCRGEKEGRKPKGICTCGQGSNYKEPKKRYAKITIVVDTTRSIFSLEQICESVAQDIKGMCAAVKVESATIQKTKRVKVFNATKQMVEIHWR
jgi:hypothetical protein